MTCTALLDCCYVDIRFCSNALIDYITMLCYEVLTSFVNCYCVSSFLFEFFPYFRDFKCGWVWLLQNKIVIHPIFGVVWFVKKAEDSFVLLDFVEYLLWVRHIVLEWVVYGRIFCADDESKTILHVDLTGTHCFNRIVNRQSPDFVCTEYVRHTRIHSRCRIAQRNELRQQRLKWYIITKNFESLCILVFIYRRWWSESFGYCFLYLLWEWTVRSYGIEFWELRLSQKCYYEDRSDCICLEVFTADFQQAGFVFPALCIFSVHGAKDCYIYKPLIACWTVIQAFTGFQSLRHIEQFQDVLNLLHLCFWYDILFMLSVCYL